VNLFARILCKIVEFVLRFRTFLIHGPKIIVDPTWLLVNYQSDAQLTATENLAASVGLPQGRPLSPGELKARVEEKRALQTAADRKPRVAVIIPFRDAWTMTLNCVESLLNQNLKEIQLTLCLVDNGSCKNETAKGVDEFRRNLQRRFPQEVPGSPQLHVLRDNRPFNFSELNNAAVQFLTDPQNSAAPEFLLFLNNDTLWESPNSLERLVFFATLSPSNGAVGCTLLYRNSRVQHLFLAPGVKLAGAHPGKGICLNMKHEWYADPRPVAAVTGALLLVSTSNFLQAKGFDSALATSCQDLDLCLKLQDLGLENWVVSDVFVRHFETSTRLKKNQASEITYVSSKWGARLAMNQFYSAKISRWSERPALSWAERAYPWSAVLRLQR
jgi:GT2 family glycosyltransferase